MLIALMTGRHAMEILGNRQEVTCRVRKKLRRLKIAALKWVLLTVVFIGNDKTK